MFDEDYSFLTGGLGDLDGDGRVDFAEYLNEEYEYEQIMGSKDDDYSVLDDDDDFDDYSDDYDDGYNDEDYDDDYDDGYNDEDDEEDNEIVVYVPDDFDVSRLSITIGPETSLNYDGKPIDQVFGVDISDNTVDEQLNANKQKNCSTVGANQNNTATSKTDYIDTLASLTNENRALKSKITRLEKTITNLNYNIQRLEADLAAKRKGKQWDGKYYRYCEVVLDESPNGLWYRTDDITIKEGDYVYVPYGYKNEEKMAKVASVKEFRSDDIPFPLERTKFVHYKCEK
ncbi:MAG: hypothetical protein IJF54_03415 [Clostridia bacterium]|nr:hypothetical protein [Clostridia bacterium]